MDEEYLVMEREVVEYLVWYQSLDFQGVENLDFMVRELKSLGQMNQYQTELWQVLVEFVMVSYVDKLIDSKTVIEEGLPFFLAAFGVL